MGIKFVVKQTPEPPAGQWYQVLSDEAWTPGPGVSWSGSSWDSAFGLTGLSELGAWNVGYRPTKMRITYTGTFTQIQLVDTNFDTIANDVAPASGQEIDITFGSFDIKDLNIFASGAWSITNIEFYSEADPFA